MDPQSLAFTPQSDAWRFNSITNTMRNVQETQQDHSDRLMRLERRQDDDSRVRNVWAPLSPFTSSLTTGKNATLTQGSPNAFEGFDDDHSNNMIRSLHLDAEDEPRRLGAGSRTNSVRFDDSANQAQWSHATRQSVDALSRSASGLGGYGLFDRSTSHRSDGRHSSAGQSASGRANSFGFEIGQSLRGGDAPLEPPGLAPGLFILGSVPSIIRCWLNTNFKHDSLLYAVVCTGSYKSYLDWRMVEKLGFSGEIRTDLSGDRKLKIPMYLPEAVPQTASSRSSSPAPQLPSILVDFTIIDRGEDQPNSKAIQIFLGSDMLSAHSADIHFSSNSITLFDDERCKLSIPFVRPENDETFKSLYITTGTVPRFNMPIERVVGKPALPESDSESRATSEKSGGAVEIEKLENTAQTEESGPGTLGSSRLHGLTIADAKQDSKPPLTVSTKVERPDGSPPPSSSGRNSSPAVWNSWRRDGVQGDWAAASRNASTSYQRPNREQGIKILKPTRQLSRSSATPSSSASPSTAQSRFFDDGKRRTISTSGPASDSGDSQQLSRTTSEAGKPGAKEATTAANSANKLRGVNPIGGASAFGWLNTNTGK